MKINLGHIEIFVKDPLKSKEFYSNVLGFEHIETQGEKYVWMKLGDRVILLRPGKPTNNNESYQAANIGLVVYTDDVQKTVNTFKERGLVIKGDDSGCPVFTDPDGNWFQLVNPAEHIK